MQIFNPRDTHLAPSVPSKKKDLHHFLRNATYFLRKTPDAIYDLVNLHYEHTACLQVSHSIIN